MKIKVVLDNGSGELDSVKFNVDDENELMEAVLQALRTWSLCVGDTIKILEA
jgi:hypothetical protein